MSVKDIIDLINGHPGPFMETETSFLGAPYADSNRKTDRMQIDCGGGIVTKSKMTYGEANTIADSVDLADLHAFLVGPETPKWSRYGERRSPYFRDWNDDRRVYHGIIWVAVYRYLVKRKLIEGEDDSYSNSAEYLYDRVCDRLVAAGFVTRTDDRQYFDLLTTPS